MLCILHLKDCVKPPTNNNNMVFWEDRHRYAINTLHIYVNGSVQLSSPERRVERDGRRARPRVRVRRTSSLLPYTQMIANTIRDPVVMPTFQKSFFNAHTNQLRNRKDEGHHFRFASREGGQEFTFVRIRTLRRIRWTGGSSTLSAPKFEQPPSSTRTNPSTLCVCILFGWMQRTENRRGAQMVDDDNDVGWRSVCIRDK